MGAQEDSCESGPTCKQGNPSRDLSEGGRRLATKLHGPSLHCPSSVPQPSWTSQCHPLVCLHLGWNKKQLRLQHRVTVDRFSQFHHGVTSSVAVRWPSIEGSESQGYQNDSSLGKRATFHTVTQQLDDISSAVSYGRLGA